MKNPWEEIDLEIYESHMRLDSVMQLQAMNAIMKKQLEAYPAATAMILGVAGGNGLEHIRRGKYHTVYGVDINADYLRAVSESLYEQVSLYSQVQRHFRTHATQIQGTEPREKSAAFSCRGQHHRRGSTYVGLLRSKPFRQIFQKDRRSFAKRLRQLTPQFFTRLIPRFRV